MKMKTPFEKTLFKDGSVIDGKGPTQNLKNMPENKKITKIEKYQRQNIVFTGVR